VNNQGNALPPIKFDANKFRSGRAGFPPLPELIHRLLKEVNDPRGSINQMATMISSDAAMTSHILKVVNSAYYSLPKRVGDLKFAIAYLGLREITSIVLALSVIKALAPGLQSDLKDFWRQSYLTALASSRIAKELGPIHEADDLYASALLMNIGQLFYMRYYSKHFVAMTEYCHQNKVLLCHAERHFGVPSNGMFGALLCKHWRLPPAIGRACELHDFRTLKACAPRGEADPFELLVSVSNHFAILCLNDLTPQLGNEVVREIRRVMNYSEDEFTLMMSDVHELKFQTEELLRSLS
jgi:HD-like signal output (HDOD) protein